MILLIDNSIITPLSTEIEQLKTDLVGDGWLVEKLLFIFGHVPVARSGLALEAADNHPENEGALASDAYYAEMVILMSGLVSDYLALY
jgi:hypothetical protein